MNPPEERSADDSAGNDRAARVWTRRDARDWIAVPSTSDDKYSRGVLGMITGSAQYPGAAVLGADAAVRAGIGMVRYLGDARAADLVLRRRPEVVTAPGRVQAWLLGSGQDAATRTPAETGILADALGQAIPVVLDAGALDLAAAASSAVIITPHFRELAGVLATRGVECSAQQLAADP
ncbi:MAG: NAD(P)H-hydrate dehydratase, partial [Microbacteriaceae bacterium]